MLFILETKLYGQVYFRNRLKNFVRETKKIEPYGHTWRFAQEYANLMQEDIDRLVVKRQKVWWDSAAGLKFRKAMVTCVVDSLSKPSYMRQLFTVEKL